MPFGGVNPRKDIATAPRTGDGRLLVLGALEMTLHVTRSTTFMRAIVKRAVNPCVRRYHRGLVFFILVGGTGAFGGA